MMACAVTDLPEPDSPTTQTISPGADRERDVLDRVDAVRAGREADREALDVEDGLVGHAYTRLASFGSSRSRSPSPSTLTASTVSARQMPGKKMLCG